MEEQSFIRKIELLAPARDRKTAQAAICNGADAVYIGAPSFGARQAAGNSLEDIAALIHYAHRFYCRVFITMNTLLYDEELAAAERLCKQLYKAGADALIIQDPGLLQLDLPPVALHASTQMHNYDPERIKFLDRLGFQRIVLAREMSLAQIREIRKDVKAELEVFIHGALCVSFSGQCYLSHYMCGRSANRGECAQPCRMKWSVKDATGKFLVRDKHILSLKDLNLSAHIPELIEAGVDSFKIEGRLKDENYVANVVNHYHSLLNRHLGTVAGIKRVGSGNIVAGFTPDPERSFNRGYTDYFFAGRQKGMVNPDTPKSIGKKVGTVRQAKGNRLTAELFEPVHNGDGLCYSDRDGLKGIKVNRAEGSCLICNETLAIKPGTEIYRNYDHHFVALLEKNKSFRKIGIHLEAEALCDGRLQLNVKDEDGIQARYESGEVFEEARNPEQKATICRQLSRCGDTDFVCERVGYTGNKILFIPAAALNGMRRELLQQLEKERAKFYPKLPAGRIDSCLFYRKAVDWHWNVVNAKAEEFYRNHGVESIETGFEKNSVLKNKDLMRTRYCLLYELGRCRKRNKNTDIEFPLFLTNGAFGFRLEFDCSSCCMKILAEE